MSLEAKIEALTQAVQALTAQLQSAPAAQAAPAPVVAVPLEQPVPAPVAPPVAAAPAMPAPPAFVAPAPAVAPATSGAPFTDSKGLIEYVMTAYKALGPQKGAQIQGVLTNLGYQNINDVKPEHYAQLHAGIEALK
jgi:hypothetical protein